MKTKDFIERVFSLYRGEKIEIQFPDGEIKKFGEKDGGRFVRVKFVTEKGLKNFMLRGDIGFAESYMLGEIQVEGDLADCLSVPDDPSLSLFEPTVRDKVKFLTMYLKNRNTLKGSKRNIKSHYDLGNDFYRMWLDENMQYTCAFF